MHPSTVLHVAFVLVLTSWLPRTMCSGSVPLILFTDSSRRPTHGGGWPLWLLSGEAAKCDPHATLTHRTALFLASSQVLHTTSAK